jgi:hypothetical protein
MRKQAYKRQRFFVKFIPLVIWLEIVAAALLIGYQPRVAPFTIQHDDRPAKLAIFMDKHKFAKPYYIHEFIQSADKNKLDFALLPTIELAESSGGKRFLQDSHNPFGWNSDQSGFKSIPDGIDFISTQLGTGHYYAGKSTYLKLRAYNPNPAYAARAMKLIEEIHNE